MLTGLTTSAMLAVMGLHAVFGCCWHHDHEHRAEHKAEDATATTSCDHDHDHGRHEHQQSGGHAPHAHWGGEAPEGGHDHHEDCGSDLCHFVSSPLVDVPVAQIGWFGDATSDANVASLLAVAILDAQAARADILSGGSAPSLRLLTRLCVWRL